MRRKRSEDQSPIAAPEMEEPTSPEGVELSEPQMLAQVPEPTLAPSRRLRVKARGRSYYNPFSKISFAEGAEVEAELDGWLQSQLDAGYIVRV